MEIMKDEQMAETAETTFAVNGKHIYPNDRADEDDRCWVVPIDDMTSEKHEPLVTEDTKL